MLQQSVPFSIAILYIMVQNVKFSFIICSCNARKTSSLHTIYSKTKHKQSNLLPSTTIEYIFPSFRIRYFILLAINTHIDCSNNSKRSVWCILKATARSLESVSSSIFCYVCWDVHSPIQGDPIHVDW